MLLEDAVSYVSQKFHYKRDKKPFLDLFDHWFIMKERDGKFYGDCEDYSLTVLWFLCDKSLLKFIWYVLILHRYKLYRLFTISGEAHIVGKVGDLWFDNWTLKAMPKAEFFKYTGHNEPTKDLVTVIGMLYPLLVGLFTR